MGIDFSDFDPDDVGGFDRVSVGSYHVQITSLEPDAGKRGELVGYFEVLAGTDPTQVGKEHREQFPVGFEQWMRKKIAALALASGALTIEAAKAAKAAGKEAEVDWSAGVGRQVCLDIDLSKDGKYTNIKFDHIWPVTDKKANHIPLNKGMLDRAGIVLPVDRPVEGVRPAAKPVSGSGANGAATKQELPADLLANV